MTGSNSDLKTANTSQIRETWINGIQSDRMGPQSLAANAAHGDSVDKHDLGLLEPV